MKIKVLLLALFIMNVFQMSAQNKDEVTLVVSAEGTTKDEAIQMALRSAIEQAYGVFVSANTSILNDELVKDEIATLSLGNIKGYKELSSEMLPNGNVFATLQAIVSISKLVNYAQSKGTEVEFAGATFAMNIKMEELNTRNEEKIIANMLSVVEKLYMTGFDYKISVSDTQADGQMTADIDVYANENALKAYELFYNTLENVSLSQDKIKEYEKLKKEVYAVGVYPITSTKLIGGLYRSNKFKRTEGYTFRSENTLALLSQFFNFTYPKALLNICISTDVDRSQIHLISSCSWVSSSSNFGQSNINRYGDAINEKEIFSQRIPAYVSYLSREEGLTDYTRNYIAKEHLLNYIMSIDDIENFCFFSYCEDTHPYGVTDKAYIAGYPKHKKGASMHHIKLKMQIPLDDLMKISKFTITRNYE